jgi:hypothetical protein
MICLVPNGVVLHDVTRYKWDCGTKLMWLVQMRMRYVMWLGPNWDVIHDVHRYKWE